MPDTIRFEIDLQRTTRVFCDFAMDPIATNTLVIINYKQSELDLTRLMASSALVQLKKSFGRYFAVFDDTYEAMRVKDNLIAQKIRVYYGLHTSMIITRLQVPELEKNFLLSPPGEVPIGWVQAKESHPSIGGLLDKELERELMEFKLEVSLTLQFIIFNAYARIALNLYRPQTYKYWNSKILVCQPWLSKIVTDMSIRVNKCPSLLCLLEFGYPYKSNIVYLFDYLTFHIAALSFRPGSNFHLALSNFGPISRQTGTTGLNKRFFHCSASLFASIFEDALEQVRQLVAFFDLV